MTQDCQNEAFEALCQDTFAKVGRSYYCCDQIYNETERFCVTGCVIDEAVCRSAAIRTELQLITFIIIVIYAMKNGQQMVNPS